MKKRNTIAVAVATALMCCAFGLAACGKNPGSNVHKHELTLVNAKSATCTEDGNLKYYACYGCNKWFEDESGKTEIREKSAVILPKGHKLSFTEGYPATCTEDGVVSHYKCSVCNKWFFDEAGENEIADMDSVILEKGHKLTYVPYKDSTCAKVGNTAYYSCSGCSKWFSDEEAEEEIEDKSSVTIARKEHDISFVEEVEAKCDKDGNLPYYACGNCDKWFEDEDGKKEIVNKSTVITTKEHDFKDGVCTACGAHAYTDGLEYTEYGNYCSVSGIGTAIGTEIYIPEEHNGKKVTGIEERAFSGCGNITQVFIPDSVSSIGAYSFYNCTKLKSIAIPGNVTVISGNAFENCKGLESLTIGEGVMFIGDSAFKSCTNLQSVKLPDSVFNIGSRAFESCTNLKSVNIPDGVLSIGEYTFAYCSNLDGIIIPDSVRSIGSHAFDVCNSLSSITIPLSVTTIGNYAFNECIFLTRIIYKGTSSKWEAIDKGYGWDKNTANYTIQCTDKNIEKE